MSQDTLSKIVSDLRSGAEVVPSDKLVDRLTSILRVRAHALGWRFVPAEATDKMIDTVRAGTIEPQSMQAQQKIVDGWKSRWRSLVAAAPFPPFLRLVMHKKRGSNYAVLGEATLQTATPAPDMTALTIYQAEDGSLWGRPTAEFEDGRFQEVSAAGSIDVFTAHAVLPTDALPIQQPTRLSLNGFQIKALMDMVAGESDSQITVAHFPADKDAETGEPMPEGLWAFYTEHPEEGRFFLPTEESDFHIGCYLRHPG